ncbi:MAG: type II toxin-antitoxin system PemK/MazF family toxin [Sulfurimonas sp.]|nr:type II toxin-antitoxin system PemK/MazF family toxin [Sulfurimonas sp.]MDQ7062198.1 type II toxin-antitoxin system PemK/MazF family toxin [Sulfurimonas sp.]
MQKYDEWTKVKRKIDSKEKLITYKERDIFWANIGENIGFEQNGKGSDFMRPILVFRKFTNKMFFGIPLSTQLRDGSFFFQFQFLEDKKSTALLVQAKMFDVKRLDRRIGMINKDDFKNLESKMRELMKL